MPDRTARLLPTFTLPYGLPVDSFCGLLPICIVGPTHYRYTVLHLPRCYVYCGLTRLVGYGCTLRYVGSSRHIAFARSDLRSCSTVGRTLPHPSGPHTADSAPHTVAYVGFIITGRPDAGCLLPHTPFYVGIAPAVGLRSPLRYTGCYALPVVAHVDYNLRWRLVDLFPTLIGAVVAAFGYYVCPTCPLPGLAFVTFVTGCCHLT